MGTSISSPERSCSSVQDKPLRFLDLPIELRYIVYEQIEISARHYRLKDPTFKYESDEETLPPSCMTLVVKTLPVALLATCRLIHKEAAYFFAPKLEMLRDEPTHFIIDSTSFHNFANRQHSISTMLVKQEFDKFTQEWDGVSADKDPLAWIPHKLCFGQPPSHVFLRGSKEHAAIVAFYKKCFETRRRRFTTKTVITIRYCFGPPEDFPSDFDLTFWLSNRAKDGLEPQLGAFPAEDVQMAILYFESVKFMHRLDDRCRIREISDAKWKVVSARDDVVTLNEEAISECGLLRKRVFSTIQGVLDVFWYMIMG